MAAPRQGNLKTPARHHPLLDTTSSSQNRLPHPLDVELNSRPDSPLQLHKPLPHPTTFDEFLAASPLSPDVIVRPSLDDRIPSTKSPPPPYEPFSLTTRIFSRLGLSSSAEAEQQATIRQARHEYRQESRRVAKEHRRVKRDAIREEKARNQWLGGLAWGFDPEAGKKVDVEACAKEHLFAKGHTKLVDGVRVDAATEEDEKEHYWLEAGGPGNEGRFGYGLLKTRDAEVLQDKGRKGVLKLKAPDQDSVRPSYSRKSSSTSQARPRIPQGPSRASSQIRHSLSQPIPTRPPSPQPQGWKNTQEAKLKDSGKGAGKGKSKAA